MTPPPPSMPVICYSPRFHEAEITMDRTAGRELAEIIARGEGELAGDQTADPSPYEELLNAVRVAPAPSGSEGKVVLGLSDDGKTLTITGAREHLAVLAKVVRELADDPDLRPITHVHVEYFEGHYYLAESEVSIVLRVAV